MEFLYTYPFRAGEEPEQEAETAIRAAVEAEGTGRRITDIHFGLGGGFIHTEPPELTPELYQSITQILMAKCGAGTTFANFEIAQKQEA